MVRANSLLKILIVGVCMVFYGIPSAFSDDVTTNYKSGDDKGTQKGYATPSINTGGNSTPSSGGSSGGTSSGDDDTIEEPVDHDTYSNIYPDSEEGLPILPEAMVVYCKFNAADAVKDLNIITECIKKYVNAMNNTNVAAKAEALHEYDTMRVQALLRTLMESSAIVSNVPNYEKVMEEYKKSAGESKTEYDAIQANTSALAFTNKLINSVRKIYSEYLQYLAIDGIASIDPTAVASEEEVEEAKTTAKGSAEMKSKAGTTKASTVIEATLSGGGAGGSGGGDAGSGGDSSSGNGGTDNGNGGGNGTGDGNDGAGDQGGNDGNASGGNDNGGSDNDAGDGNSKADPNGVDNYNQQIEEHNAYIQELLRQREEAAQGNNSSDGTSQDSNTTPDPERDADWNERMDNYNDYIKALLEQREGAQ